MTLERLTIRKTNEEVEAQSGWTTRVFVDVDQAPTEGLGMTAELGGQQIEALGVVFGLTPKLSGYLRTPPNVGDELVITIGTTSIPTGLKVEEQPIA